MTDIDPLTLRDGDIVTIVHEKRGVSWLTTTNLVESPYTHNLHMGSTFGGVLRWANPDDPENGPGYMPSSYRVIEVK